MKILIADKLSQTAISALEALGHTVVSNPDLTADDLPAAIGNAEVLIVRSTKVTANTISAAKNLSLIIRAGAGVNTIDLAKASELGIHVTNCPGKNTDAVAELAIGLLIAADRRIPNATADLRAGRWNKKEYGRSAGLKGRTLGIIGVGAIGKAVIRRALGLEMNIIAWSRSLTPKIAGELGVAFAPTPIDVAKTADAISLHVAATPETKGMINHDFLSAMKKNAILINAARGDIVDPLAVKQAIATNGLRYACDVYSPEPAGGVADFPPVDLAAAAVACTPHIGASTDQAAEAIAAEAVRIVRVFQQTGTPPNGVNIRANSPAVASLVVRHYNKVGVIAGVLTLLRNAGVNIEEMQNLVFEGGSASCCTLKLDSKPDDALLAKIAATEHIISASLK